MRIRTFMRTAVARLASATALALAVAAGAANAVAADATSGEQRHNVVKDPYFGDVLFYFFQDRYFTSLTNLMVAQHFDRVSHHADEAEVLRGGLYLSYGLHREAGEIFAQLIEKSAVPAVRDRAWYYLAKIRYQRGLLAPAEEAIGRIKGHLPPDLEEDRALLQANLLMARGDYVGAAAVLKPLAADSNAGLYARYNLGVALIMGGTAAQGSEILDQVGAVPATSEEIRNLRDKANVALGFAALKDKEPERARIYLERVRLSGMFANKALLGFGWAADALDQPQAALVPWTELQGRDPSDAAVLEAKLAVPYALAQIGSYGQSLDQYNGAIGAFEQESARLDESIAAIRAGKLIKGLLASNPGEEMGWFWNIEHLPEMPHAAHLVQVLALHEFQESFKNYRDLQFLARNLRQWDGNLGVIGDMLANRRQAFAQRLPQVRAKERGTEIASLEKQRDELAGELARAEEQSDGFAFADQKERELGVRLDRVRATLDREAADPEMSAAGERYRRVVGALRWQLAQEFPTRLWEAKKDFKQFAGELAGARGRDAELAQAEREEPAHFEKFAERIDVLRRRILALMPRVTELIERQRQAVQELAVTELLRQKERLAAYTTQARFAVAQIYDRAGLAKDGVNAPVQ
ncbi:conserved exported hypothetical protein [Burkholderiales bacterium]|nr:conserved exported hypothetical protein [Burkholderiales bacterium]